MADEQAAMVRRLVLEPAGVAVVVGQAGTGKTFALDAAREAWEASGRRVIGVAVVRLRGQLKQLAAGRAEHPLEAATVSELLRELERAEPAMTGWILDERGRIRRHINVFVNGEYGGEDTAVAADDRVDVLPAISGGTR